MKVLLLFAALLTSVSSFASERTFTTVLNCKVASIESRVHAEGVVNQDSEVILNMIHDGSEFFAYSARIGNADFPYLFTDGQDSTMSTIGREDLGYGESFKIYEPSLSRKFTIFRGNEAHNDAELYISDVNSDAVPLAAILECK